MPLPLRGRGVVNRSDLAQGIINPMTAAFGVQAKRSRYIGGRTALARQTITPKEKRRKNIERPEGAMVYVSMDTSERIIEGNTANAGLSDLSPLPIFGGGETRMQMRKLQRSGGQ